LADGRVPQVSSMAVRRFIQYDRCIGCHTCEEVCAFLHDEIMGIELYEAVRGLKKPISCFHCVRAPCVAVCPTGALVYDREGAVVLRATRCIGCTSCITACPFGVPQLLPIGYTTKCDLCAKLRSEGLEPGCIAACPTNAIIWTSPDDLIKRIRRTTIAKIMEAYGSTSKV